MWTRRLVLIPLHAISLAGSLSPAATAPECLGREPLALDSCSGKSKGNGVEEDWFSLLQVSVATPTDSGSRKGALEGMVDSMHHTDLLDTELGIRRAKLKAKISSTRAHLELTRSSLASMEAQLALLDASVSEGSSASAAALSLESSFEEGREAQIVGNHPADSSELNLVATSNKLRTRWCSLANALESVACLDSRAWTDKFMHTKVSKLVDSFKRQLNESVAEMKDRADALEESIGLSPSKSDHAKATQSNHSNLTLLQQPDVTSDPMDVYFGGGGNIATPVVLASGGGGIVGGGGNVAAGGNAGVVGILATGGNAANAGQVGGGGNVANAGYILAPSTLAGAGNVATATSVADESLGYSNWMGMVSPMQEATESYVIGEGCKTLKGIGNVGGPAALPNILSNKIMLYSTAGYSGYKLRDMVSNAFATELPGTGPWNVAQGSIDWNLYHAQGNVCTVAVKLPDYNSDWMIYGS